MIGNTYIVDFSEQIDRLSLIFQSLHAIEIHDKQDLLEHHLDCMAFGKIFEDMTEDPLLESVMVSSVPTDIYREMVKDFRQAIGDHIGRALKVDIRNYCFTLDWLPCKTSVKITLAAVDTTSDFENVEIYDATNVDHLESLLGENDGYRL